MSDNPEVASREERRLPSAKKMDRRSLALIPRSLALVCLCAALAAHGAWIGKTVENYPDGSVHLDYETNDEGEPHGRFTEYHTNGKLKILTTYKNGLRHRLFTEYYESGRTRIHATYRDGELDGSYTERYENNKVRMSATYRRGLLNGKYVERFSSGKSHVTAVYRDGELDGDYREWDESGALRVEGGYRDGALHGERRFYEGTTLETIQVWNEGTIELLDGVPVHPKSEKAVRSELHRLSGEGLPPDEASAEFRSRDAALRRLKAYRFLCDVPYDDVEIEEQLNDYATQAAKICSSLGGLTHDPENPDWPRSEFERAHVGASNSNLYFRQAFGYTPASDMLVDAVNGFMDDSNPRNVESVGHRRWCLNPGMRKTGFGEWGDYAAMWATDSTRSSLPSCDFVSFPPRGYMSLDYMPENVAWSISPDPDRFPLDGTHVEVTVRELDEEYRKTGERLDLKDFNVDRDVVGSHPCIIFRPLGVSYSPGRRYWVEVTGIESRKNKASTSIRYVVEFFEATRLDPATRQ